MTRHNDEAMVLEVASLIEDRTPQEQRAMIAMALRLDHDRGLTAAQYRGDQLPIYPTLFDRVVDSYDPDTDQRQAHPSAKQWDTHGRQVAAWASCIRCTQPIGVHYLDDKCPLSIHWVYPGGQQR